MRAVTVIPGSVGSARLDDVPEPGPEKAWADRTWLEQIVTRRVAAEDFQKALQRQPDDIKVVIEFGHP